MKKNLKDSLKKDYVQLKQFNEKKLLNWKKKSQLQLQKMKEKIYFFQNKGKEK